MYLFLTQSFISLCCNSTYRLRYWNGPRQNVWDQVIAVATAPTVYGIETDVVHYIVHGISNVATAPTVYGIETLPPSDATWASRSCNSTYRLRYWNISTSSNKPSTFDKLQQHLPFTVLKPFCLGHQALLSIGVATAPTVYGIETIVLITAFWIAFCCNSTYRLRYWNYHKISLTQQRILLSCNSTYRLRYWNGKIPSKKISPRRGLQQHLPFTVLKQYSFSAISPWDSDSCNSTYRLRYWNSTESRIFLWNPRFCVATAPTVYGIETSYLPFCFVC